MDEDQAGTAMRGVHGRPRPTSLQPFLAFAFAAEHSALDISTKPWPLQEFMPLQEFLADLQEDCPLHEFTPVHCTFASSALAVTVPNVPNSTAAAVAIATPPAFVVFMSLTPYLRVIGLSRRAARCR